MRIVETLTALGITFMTGLALARPEVVFPNEAEVSSTSVISVFQVAELKELTGHAFTEIAKMPLAESGVGQEVLTLSGEDVSKKLRELVRSSDSLKKLNPSFKIPNEIRIRIRKDDYSSLEIEKSLRNILLSRCVACSFQIRLNALPKMGLRDEGIDWDQQIKYGSFMLPIRVNGGFSNKWITGTLRVQKNAPVAKKLIRFGERIQADDIETHETDITYLKEETPDISQIVGLVANRSLSPRAPILLSDLQREPAARRGQMVKALVGNQSFEVSVNASAEENGFIGDLIKIKNTETQKVMSAIVIEKGVVKVQ